MSNEITYSLIPQVFEYLMCVWHIAGAEHMEVNATDLDPVFLNPRRWLGGPL